MGTSSTADQLLGLPAATNLGSRLQPVGLLFLRDLDSASVLIPTTTRFTTAAKAINAAVVARHGDGKGPAPSAQQRVYPGH
jgi:hypothetical protein